eukprot:Hpha_TRINITY_DN9166_c0_g1::TRINITY_DN9166_c0_g1_i1::g.94367::m.94367
MQRLALWCLRRVAGGRRSVATAAARSRTPRVRTPRAPSQPISDASEHPPAAVRSLLTPPESVPQLPMSIATQGNTPGDVLRTLRDIFGNETLRPGQLEACTAALEGRDVAVFWGTGAGKSLCYQLPALHSGRIAVVISPLVSLMEDQVLNLNSTVGDKLGRPVACCLHSNTPKFVVKHALTGKYNVVYMTPERFTKEDTRTALLALQDEGKLCLVAVDEAHCVVSWGFEFRPRYQVVARSRLLRVPLMALTATASPQMRDEILSNLKLRDPVTLIGDFDRPNLVLSCVLRHSLGENMQPLIKAVLAEKEAGEPVGSTLVYTPTRGDAEKVCLYLRQRLGMGVYAYHGGMNNRQRRGVHHAFATGDAAVVVATIAFGMGIDKPDVRRIIHLGAPRTIEEYQQGIGRAGRDGKRSECVLIAHDTDFAKYHDDHYLGPVPVRRKKLWLQAMQILRDYHGNTKDCRRRLLLDIFDQKPSFGERCGECDNCRQARSHIDAGETVQMLLRAIQLLQSCSPDGATWSQLAALKQGKLLHVSQLRAKSARAEVPKIKEGFKKLKKGADFLKDVLHCLSHVTPPLVACEPVQFAAGPAHAEAVCPCVTQNVWRLTTHGEEFVEKGSSTFLVPLGPDPSLKDSKPPRAAKVRKPDGGPASRSPRRTGKKGSVSPGAQAGPDEPLAPSARLEGSVGTQSRRTRRPRRPEVVEPSTEATDPVSPLLFPAPPREATGVLTTAPKELGQVEGSSTTECPAQGAARTRLRRAAKRGGPAWEAPAAESLVETLVESAPTIPRNENLAKQKRRQPKSRQPTGDATTTKSAKADESFPAGLSAPRIPAQGAQQEPPKPKPPKPQSSAPVTEHPPPADPTVGNLAKQERRRRRSRQPTSDATTKSAKA